VTSLSLVLSHNVPRYVTGTTERHATLLTLERTLTRVFSSMISELVSTLERLVTSLTYVTLQCLHVSEGLGVL